MGDSTKPGFIAVILSVLASAFGVQSHKNYERDFQQTSPVMYVVVGVVFVILFVISLVFLVRYILS
ncbi:DUF2970 domain-containing protein [Alteromonas antoniana]|uniref:DUF2970 domain-containing protein n=1 Tax=Alteromonas antoniana TaxID=2803813 RepID=UPI0030840890